MFVEDLLGEIKEQYRNERDCVGMLDTNVTNSVPMLLRGMLKKLEHKDSGGVWINPGEEAQNGNVVASYYLGWNRKSWKKS